MAVHMKTLHGKTFIDLFCGIGGFRLAAERAGMKHLWSCDISMSASRVYAKNFSLPEWGNIRSAKTEDIPDHDFLFAGFPCQDLSNAGKREGLKGKRSGLFFEIIRIAKEKRPKVMILENVTGLLSSNDGDDLKTILKWIEALGYSVRYDTLTASDFGVPQKRQRVFFVCILSGYTYTPPKPKNIPCCVQEVLQDAFHARKGIKKKYFLSERAIKNIKEKQSSNGAVIHSRRLSEPSIANTLTKQSALGRNRRGNYIDYGFRVMRKLTPLECERLMGFPDGWTDAGLSDTKRGEALGNAVVPQVVSAILEQIKVQ